MLTLGQQFYTTALHTLVTAATAAAAWKRGGNESLAAAAAAAHLIAHVTGCSLFSHYD